MYNTDMMDHKTMNICDKKIKMEDGIPVFTAGNFFRPGESVYIHISSEFPDFVGVLHKHEFIEIVYILSGQGRHIAGEKVSPANKGDLFIVNYDTPHAFHGDESCAEAFTAYDLMFTPDFFDASMIDSTSFESLRSSYLFYSLFPEEQEFKPDLQLSGHSYYLFGDIFNKIYLEYKGMEKGYINMIRAYVIELILKILRKMESSATAPDSRAVSARQTETINMALDYLRNNYNTHITLEQLAAQTFLSKDYFGKLFKDVTGFPVSVLLQKIRIDHACVMLAKTNRTIADIAESCGFNDMKFFYSLFEKTMNLTPGEYRKKLSLSENSIYNQ